MKVSIFCIIIQSVLLLWIIRSTEACSCLSGHPQTLVCRNSFVMVAKILSRIQGLPSGGSTFGIFKYTVRVILPIKNSPKHGSNYDFTTPDDEGLCGVSYPIGSIQLLTGSKPNSISLCETLFKPTLPQLSYIFSRGKARSYLRNCECQIVDSGSTTSPRLSCRLPTNRNTRKCYIEQAFCRGQGSRCVWINIRGCP